MTGIESSLDPFVEAEIKEHHAALIRQMVALGTIICRLLMLVGLHHWSKASAAGADGFKRGWRSF
jgi:hypothetical protein